MNRLQDYFDDDDACHETGAGQLFQSVQRDPEMEQFFARPRAFHREAKPWVPLEPLAYVDGLNAHVALADNPMIAICRNTIESVRSAIHTERGWG